MTPAGEGWSVLHATREGDGTGADTKLSVDRIPVVNWRSTGHRSEPLIFGPAPDHSTALESPWGAVVEWRDLYGEPTFWAAGSLTKWLGALHRQHVEQDARKAAKKNA